MKPLFFFFLALLLTIYGCTGSGHGLSGNGTGGNASDPGRPDADVSVPGSSASNTTSPPASPSEVDIDALASKGLSMGSNDAPVVMVEFSDYQCQFCRRFWITNFDTLKEDYIDTGKVRFVYRDFPLEFHNAAKDSAEAVACAEEQGMGWEMHDKIFSVQAEKSTGLVFYARSDLKQWAGEIGLVQEEFDECFDSGRHAGEVEESVADGVGAGVNATPSFFIGTVKGSNVVPLSGALPYGTFRATIEELLESQ
ncbi:MAG: thioredoxin domain-containing protein [Candidatus Micrarchaeota archaeon]